MAREYVQFDCGEVFSGKASGGRVNGWSEPNKYTPAYNPDYVPPTWAADLCVWFMSIKEPLYIFGPTGCGKTSCLKYLASRLNYAVYEATGHNRLEFPELVGHHTVVNGNMSYEYGPLAMAMKHGGIFLINEVDLLDPSTAAGLNSVLDGSPLTIPENGGEIIHAHPAFRFVATANSNGAGDDTGLYQGVLRQNIALLDRFMLVRADYLSSAVETKLIQKLNPELPEDLIAKMVSFAGSVRRMFIGSEDDDDNGYKLDVTMSTRTLLRWAYMTQLFSPLKAKGVNVVEYALERALLYRASKGGGAALREIMQRVFG